MLAKRFFFLFVIGVAFTGYSQDLLISSFEVKGNKKLKTSAVTKICKVKVNTVLDSVKLENDIKYLKRLPSVANASYQVKRSEENNNFIVTYDIKENLTIIPSVNVFTSNDDGLAYKLGLYEFNFLGQNMTLGGFYENNVRSSFGLSFRAPYLFSKKLGAALNYQYIKKIEPIFVSSEASFFDYGNKSCEILGLYEIDFKNRIEFGINHFFEFYDNATNPDLNQKIELPQELDITKTGYRATHQFNALDFNYQYVSGLSNRATMEYINSSSDILKTFYSWQNDLNYYLPVGSDGNFASRLRLGYSTNRTVFSPFFIDNNMNIRGVGNITDRGKGMVVVNTEYRHTMIEKGWFVLQGNAFVDSGSLIGATGGLDDLSDIENIRVYSGVGLRFMHKSIFNAIFRLDYGIGIIAQNSNNSPQGLVFGIGQYF